MKAVDFIMIILLLVIACTAATVAYTVFKYAAACACGAGH